MSKQKFSNIYAFIAEREKHITDYCFDKDTLKFFGEKISDMKILKDTEMIGDYRGKFIECYVVSTLQRNDPSGAKRTNLYFAVDTYEKV